MPAKRIDILKKVVPRSPLWLGAFFLAQSFLITPVSFADDSPTFSSGSLGGSNFGSFGSILPRTSLPNFKMDTEGDTSSDSSSAQPYSLSEEERAGKLRNPTPPVNQTAEFEQAMGMSSASAPATTASTSKTTAWYKFLDPSLNLTRTLEESERKRLLSTVPLPPSLSRSGERTKGSEYVHTIILRAEAKPEYAAFKTTYGSLFARSNSTLLVSNTAKVMRIFNLTGYERDVLFKLANGQIIAIGPGSEMIISKSLNPTELNANDGIARRGFTRTMRCNELSMAFSQFSMPSILDLAEFKYFKKTQDAKISESLNKAVEALDTLRGTEGFHKVLSADEQRTRKLPTIGKAPVAPPPIRTATNPSAVPKKPSSSIIEKTNSPIANQKVAITPRKETAIASKKETVIAPKKELATNLKTNHAATSNTMSGAKKISGWIAGIKGERDEPVPSIIPPNLPSNVRDLLILAEKNEQQARDLRKNAAKNREFSEATYLSSEQRLHLFVSSKKQIKKAMELDQIAQDARAKASVAGAPAPAVQ